jgi:hypothetical protein
MNDTPIVHDLTALERVLSGFVDRREFGNEPPEDNEDWQQGFVAALDCLREELKPWWPFAQTLSLASHVEGDVGG